MPNDFLCSTCAMASWRGHEVNVLNIPSRSCSHKRKEEIGRKMMRVKWTFMKYIYTGMFDNVFLVMIDILQGTFNFRICRTYIWRWTPGDKAVVPAPELSFTYRISIALVPATELSLLWRHISPFKNMTSQERQLCSGNESYRNSVRERQLWSGNNGFVTWRSPSYLPDFMRIFPIGKGGRGKKFYRGYFFVKCSFLFFF